MKKRLKFRKKKKLSLYLFKSYAYQVLCRSGKVSTKLTTNECPTSLSSPNNRNKREFGLRVIDTLRPPRGQVKTVELFLERLPQLNARVANVGTQHSGRLLM